MDLEQIKRDLEELNKVQEKANELRKELIDKLIAEIEEE